MYVVEKGSNTFSASISIIGFSVLVLNRKLIKVQHFYRKICFHIE
jgi:hypothetical protein